MTRLVLAVLLFTGCATTGGSSTQYPPTNPDDVGIYLSKTAIPGEYETLAILTSGGQSDLVVPPHYEAARQKAAELGANGIYIYRSSGAMDISSIAIAAIYVKGLQ